MSKKLIEAAEVQRDEFGAWSHPDMPIFDEGEGAKFSAWIVEQGLESRHEFLSEVDDDSAALEAYSDGGVFTLWAPAPPEGEGWFMLAIDETEDGPVVWWVRRTATTSNEHGAGE